MRRITSLETAAASVLLLGVGLALAPETRADAWPNGMTLNGLTYNGVTVNGLTYNGLSTNGLTSNGLTSNGSQLNGVTVNGPGMNTGSLQGRGMNGRQPNDAVEAADLGALQMRAARLPDGRTLLLRQR